MKWIYILFFGFITIIFTDCSGCSKSGRDKQRRKSFNKIVNESNRQSHENDLPITIDGDSGDNYDLPRRELSPEKVLTITELAKIAEPCVFLVNNFNNKGEQLGIGTGFFIESSGIGVSNFHVFEGGSQWTIQTAKRETLRVTQILEYSEDFDYIIFQVEKSQRFPTLPIAESKPQKGEDIIVLGNPKGLESTLTRGIVSSTRELYDIADALIQIDAAISPGSSGSPVMNMKGEVIGIATMKVIECENCNFAMNINVLD